MQIIAGLSLVEVVSGATHSVFSTMMNMPLQAGESYLDRMGSPGSNGVASFIGLAGPWVGTGSVHCTAEFACKLASQLLLLECPAVNEDVLDAVAEVTNMIVGNVKTALEERLGPMGLSIPTVIYGRNFTSRTVGRQEWTVVPFSFEGEVLEVRICLTPKGEGQRVRPTMMTDAVA